MEIYDFFLQRLNEDVVNQHIMPYTVEKVSPHLLRDIRSYSHDLSLIVNYYMVDEFDIGSLKALYMELYKFMLAQGFPPHNRLKRSIHHHVLSRNTGISSSPHKSATRTLVGLLTPEQRTQFINEYIIDMEPEFM